MTETGKCPNCGATLPENAPAGQCPACLFRIGLALADGGVGFGLDEPTLQDKSAIHAPQSGFERVRYFGDYELLEVIARGGMGVVYKARQVTLNRIVAVKMIRAGVLASEADIHRFRTEAEAAGSLRHPHIVAIHEVGEHEGQHYFSMDYIEGKSLAELVREHPWPAERAAACVKTIAEAIHYSHQRGILHRDLKPSNVVVDGFGAPHITDFGLAKRLEGDSNLTASDAVLGTPSYMAPEQTMGKRGNAGAASDVYSMGAILYELLTSRPPFQGETTLDTLKLVRETDTVSPRLLNPKVPRDLETICLKCLEKEPKRRYLSAEELADDLNRFLHHEPIRARPSGGLERSIKWARRKPALAALVVVSGVAVLALAGILSIEQLRRTEYELRSQTQEALLRAERAQESETVQRKRAESEAERAAVNLYLASIAWVERNWRDKDLAGARQHLEECPIHLRNWEWHYLRRLCNSELRTLRGHASNVLAVTFDADGARLTSIGSDGTLVGWDTATGSQVSTVPVWTNGINRAAFSGNGSRLFIDGLKDQFVRAWEANSAQEIFAVKPTGSTFSGDSVAINRNGELIAVATGNDTTIRVWNLVTRELVRTIKGHVGVVNGLAFSADDKYLAWGTGKLSEHRNNREFPEQPGRAWISDLAAEGEPVALGKVETPVLATAFSPDGRWLAAGKGDRTVVAWDLKTSAFTNESDPSRILRGHAGAVLCLAFAENSSLLASGGADRAVIVWDPAAGDSRWTYLGHSNAVRTVVFRSSGDLLVSGGDDGSLKLWDLAVAPQPIRINGQSAGLAFSPDGKRLTSGSSVWSSLEGKSLAATGYAKRQGRPAFSPDGRYIATGPAIRDAQNNNAIIVIETGFKNVGNSPYGVSFSPDGKMIAMGKGDYGPGVVKIWDVSTGEKMQTFTGHTNPVWDVAFSPDGRFLASASGDFGYPKGGPGEARLWEIDTGKAIQIHRTSHCLYSISFSGDGRRFAASGGLYYGASRLTTDRGEIKVWDARTGQELFSVTNLPSCVYSVALSPDGKRLVAAVGPFGERGAFDVKLWDVESGRETLTLGRHEKVVHGVAFSPDGKRIASGGTDNVIKIWSIE